MTQIVVNLPGLTDHDAAALVHCALVEWATARGGPSSESWEHSAVEQAGKYLASRYPAFNPETGKRNYSDGFLARKREQVANRLRAIGQQVNSLSEPFVEPVKPSPGLQEFERCTQERRRTPHSGLQQQEAGPESPAMSENPYSIEAQLERLRTMPPFVVWLTQGMGCWVIGSQAAFLDVRIHARSDWDILVPFEAWEQVAAALPLHGKRTKPGGWRFEVPANADAAAALAVIDVFPGAIGALLQKPYVHVAWHPKTATILEVKR